MSYLDTHKKESCSGCEACAQICGKQAIQMQEDSEGFRYPMIDENLCINCGMCRDVCPIENIPFLNARRYVLGGYHKKEDIRRSSTSGGAFSAIVETWCDNNYVIFGASTHGLEVYHTFITDKQEIDIFRKSKYSQSKIGHCYQQTRNFLKEGKKVIFSGTPCQIAGLKKYLNNCPTNNLLTIEVICEGVPSPLYIRKMDDYYKTKYGVSIDNLDYRYKEQNAKGESRKWDFEMMHIHWQTETHTIDRYIDRWFNPFWSIWLNHLMSRPSCYKCPFTQINRAADITLGDLWGVHLYCPELYGKNGGASLIIGNTAKGEEAIHKAETLMIGHELDFEKALRYQGPLKRTIAMNPQRDSFMEDLKGDMTFKKLNKKWSKGPSPKLLFQKYIWGNRQKVWLWNILNKHK